MSTKLTYDDFQNKTFKTLLFILREKWPCPLCGEVTRVARIHCEQCKRDMGISKYQFEARLRKICPPEIYDHHRVGFTQYEDVESPTHFLKGGEQTETLF
jgi:hypothetical protein